jgi:hypothetical protein
MPRPAPPSDTVMPLIARAELAGKAAALVRPRKLRIVE